jgi:omega-6 fatty acid desaturase (delta-12 desaturase)
MLISEKFILHNEVIMNKILDRLTKIQLISHYKKMLAPYQKPNMRKSITQLLNSLLPYFFIWVLMILSLQYSYWITLLLIIPAAGFLIRIFIIFHDCGHHSFFKSNKANSIVGFFLGVLAFTPSDSWWHDHAVHHATVGNLEKRGTGDVMTMTVEEYRRSNWVTKASYAFFRYPLVMFGLGPIFVFMLRQRIPPPRSRWKEIRSVLLTDLALIFLASGLTLLFGWKAFVLIQIPVMWLAGLFGIYLFYIQHQFENVYWAHDEQWDFISASRMGASYFKLPGFLNWFTGNIGYHHIHHLNPRIPNYNLQECYKTNPELHDAPTITLASSIKSLGFRLWDENSKKMTGFKVIQNQS